MANASLHTVDVKNIISASTALDELRQLNERLEGLGLEQFQLFNSAYCIVTEHIHRAMEEDYFKDPSFIDEFIVTFVGYYMTALNDITSGKLDKSSPWFAMNEYSKITSAPVFLSLLMGASAHINHDLPHALHELTRKRKSEPPLDDIVKINKLLMKSGLDIARSFDETNTFYDFLKRHFQFAYYRPAMYTILYWRVIAWRNYRRLLGGDAAKSRISKRSQKIAKRLLAASRILS